MKANLQREGEMEREILQLLTHSSNGHSDYGWASMDPEAPTCMHGPKHLSHPQLLFPGHSQGTGLEVEQPGLNPVLL